MSSPSRYRRSAANPFAHKRALSFASKQKLDEMRAAFALFDEDGSGAIDKEELMKAIRELGHEDITMGQVVEMMKTVDKDASGEIDFDEFVILIENNLQSLEMGGARMDDLSDEEYPETPANQQGGRPGSSVSGTADFVGDIFREGGNVIQSEERFKQVRDLVVKAVVKCQNGAHLDTVLERDLADVSRGELEHIISKLRGDLNEMMERASSLCSLMLDFDERISTCKEQQRELSTKFDQESQSMLEDLRSELPFLQKRRVETERAMFDVQAQQKLLDKLYPYMQALAIEKAKIVVEGYESDEEGYSSESTPQMSREPSPPKERLRVGSSQQQRRQTPPSVAGGSASSASSPRVGSAGKRGASSSSSSKATAEGRASSSHHQEISKRASPSGKATSSGRS